MKKIWSEYLSQFLYFLLNFVEPSGIYRSRIVDYKFKYLLQIGIEFYAKYQCISRQLACCIHFYGRFDYLYKWFYSVHTVCPINFILQCNKCQSTRALLAYYECFRSRSGFLSSLIFREKQSSFENEFRDSFSAFYVDFIGNFWKRGESRLCGLSENYALGCWCKKY